MEQAVCMKNVRKSDALRNFTMSRLMGAALAVAVTASAQAMPPQMSGAEGEATMETTMKVTKVTPVLLAENVAACVDFWKQFGFEPVVTVPDGAETGFAMLTNGAVELMYQSFSMSNASDPKAIEGVNRAVIYLDITDFDSAVKIIENYEIVKPTHKTDYGLREIYFRDPAGNLIGFAESRGT
jgi:catechol 2,3-dioxygenase-like lactoylglutathione lyase family enzyme